MQYSKLLFILPLASATVVRRDQVVEVDYVTAVETDYVTQYGTVPPASAPTAPAPAPPAAAPPAPPAAPHGHAQFHQHDPVSVYQAPTTWSAPPPPPSVYSHPAPPPPVYTDPAPAPPAEPAPAPPAAPSESAPAPSGDGGSSSGGCPADTSGKYLSPSVDEQGNPAGGAGKSMIDSMNYIRRLYNESAACLEWSDSLAAASSQCANQGNENNCCRANSEVISDTKYGQDGYKGPLSSSVFEGAMFMMLCQSPSDPQLKKTCTGKTGEESYTGVGSQTTPCTSGACTGHRDAIVDAEGKNHFMGVGTSGNGLDGAGYMSCSFATTNGIFS